MVGIIAAATGLVVVVFLTYWLALGEISLLLWCVIPVAAGIWAFAVTLKKVTAYISN
jgi:hypothetical protein